MVLIAENKKWTGVAHGFLHSREQRGKRCRAIVVTLPLVMLRDVINVSRYCLSSIHFPFL